MKIVVAGHGMVGHQFLQSLAETGLTDAQVTVLCEEARPAYDRVHLSEFFAGKSAQDLSLVEPGFFERTGFDLRLAARAASVDRRVRTVTTADGEVLPYDVLVLATGSVPLPPIAGRERPNCFVYRTIDDLEAMQAASAKARRGVVVGGGLLGLECAKPCATWAWKPMWWSSPAPDGGAGGRAAAASCARRSRPWACTCTPGAAPPRSPTARSTATAWCSRTAATSRPT
jgi:NAD(P)H-nitrite reductase large subunit